ncbi:MAG TPA: hypothetical protein VGG01_08220 [Xanthobacteraceae bacterium]|jgi:chromosome segregation ATPase
MDWMQQHMRRHLAEGQGEPNVLSLRSEPAQSGEVGAKTLELVERAVEHIRQTEQAAAERHARAEMLARRTIEQVNAAEERARSSEMALRAAETQAERNSLKLQQMELELQRAATELAAARTDTSAAESRARDAERRAAEAENALKSVEATIRRLLTERGLVGVAA